MCHECDAQLDHMARHLDELVQRQRDGIAAGRVRDTPGQRVADLAEELEDIAGESEHGVYQMTYMLALAVERLTALEQAGITT